MATNYTFAQVCKIINDGDNHEALIDIGRKFPLTLRAVSLVTAVAGDNFVDLMGFMPEYVTAKKFETAIRSGIVENDVNEITSDDDEEISTSDENTEAEAGGKKAGGKKAKKSEATEDAGEAKSFESMSGKELWDLLGKAGKRKDCKEKMGGCKKEQMVEYINKYGLDDEATDPPAEVDDEDETEEAKQNPYDGMTAPELFKECKNRGIKAAPKKPAKFYVDLLLKDDAAKSDGDEAEDSDDGWGDDEAEQEEAPKTSGKKASKTKDTKPAKKAAQAEDDDENWDI